MAATEPQVESAPTAAQPDEPSVRTGPDSLLEALHLLATMHGKTISPEALVAGLPLEDGRLTPSIFVRAAERIGFSAKIVKRSLGDISDLVLPAVLILEDEQVCIYNAVLPDKMAEILLPASGGGAKQVPLDELSKRYSGYAIFVQPIPDLEDQLGAAYIGGNKGTSWFWRTLFQYRRLYLEVAIASVLINLFVLASPLFVRRVYDGVIPNQAGATLWVLAIGVLIVFCFDFVLRIVRAYFISVAGKRADVVLASKIFSQILNMRLADRPPTAGSFANEVREFETVRDFFSSATVAVILDMPFVFLFIAIIWFISGPVVMVPLVAVPMILIVGFLLQGPLSKVVMSHMGESSRRHSLLVETIFRLETVKAMGVSGWRQKRWEEAVGVTSRSALSMRLLSSLGMFFSAWVQQMVTVAVIIVGFYEIIAGTLTMGGLIASTILVGRAIAPLGQFANLLTRLQQSKVALESINRVMSLPPERDPSRNYLSRPVIKGRMEFRNVVFSYPQQKVPALAGVSFNVRAGEKVGILGKVGSGKSTVLRLVLGLYQPTEGSILMDGIDLEQIDPVDLRSNVGYVPQGASLFQGSVRENLVAMTDRVDTEELDRATEISGLKSVVARHPQGLDMPVGESGGLLSGGQRQLVVITQAVMRDCPIMLFDEPTASLDNSAERSFIVNMKKFLEHKTLLLVTHKVALLEMVDRLIIFDDGRIVADGPKEAVIKALNNREIRSKN